MTRSLVTGAAGFIGSHLVDYLTEQGHSVIQVDNQSANNDNFYWSDTSHSHMVDITNYDDMRELFEGVDAVTSRIIRDMLMDYIRRGSTIFLTSHVLDVVEKLCTHVGIIAKGKLVEQAELNTLRKGSSLEQRFLEKVGADEEAIHRLSWLHEETL